MKKLLVVLFLLVPAASSFAEIRTVRIVFTSCLRGACLADATNAVKDAKIGVVGKLSVIHLDDGLASFTRDPKTPLNMRELARQIAHYNSGLKMAILEVDGAVAPNARIKELGLDLRIGQRACSTPVRPEWGKPAAGKTWLAWEPTQAVIDGSGSLDVCIVQ